MPILRVDPRKAYLGAGKGRKAKQTKYGKIKGKKPAGIINRLRK